MQAIKYPHVTFEVKAEAYADNEGHTLYRDKYFVTITPAGGKDQIYKEAEGWLKELERKGMDRTGFDPAAEEYAQWHTRFTTMFARFKEGHELILDGTPLRATLAFSPAEIATAEQVKIFTVEDLASANEQAIERMGMGARNMKHKAAKIAEAIPGNKLAEENAALRLSVDELKEHVHQLMAAQQPEKKGKAA